MAHWQLAEHEEAEEWLSRAVAQSPGFALFETQRSTLARWRERCRAVLPGALETLRIAPSDTVCATLLGPHHAEALCYHHRAADVPRLANVTPLRSVIMARQWVEAQEDIPGTVTLAVVEANHGLVGSVALRQVGRAARFYYWIGERFQRHGYGAFALRVLCVVAAARHVTNLYSAVYRDNSRSRRVLDKEGFRALNSSVRARPGHTVVYHRELSAGTAREAEDASGELSTLVTQGSSATGRKGMDHDHIATQAIRGARSSSSRGLHR